MRRGEVPFEPTAAHRAEPVYVPDRKPTDEGRSAPRRPRLALVKEGASLGMPEGREFDRGQLVDLLERAAEQGDPEILNRISKLASLLALPDRTPVRSMHIANVKREIMQSRTLEEFQQIALEYFETLGVIETRGGMLIADLDKIRVLTAGYIPSVYDRKQKFFYEDAAQLRTAYDRPPIDFATYEEYQNKFRPFLHYCRGSLQEFLYQAFKGKKVVSKAEWSEWQKRGRRGSMPAAKPLLYAPENMKAAFDATQIKRADAHLGVWDLKIYSSFEHEYLSNLKGASVQEVSIACIIYHPKYGDGKRDVRGNLIVTYPSGDRKKISANWFGEMGGLLTNSSHRKVNLASSPRLALESGNLPHLVETGLLLPADFSFTTTSAVSSLYGLGKDITNKSGRVSIGGRQYLLGTDYRPEEAENGNLMARYKVYRISDKVGGVVALGENGEERMAKVFDLDPTLPPILAVPGKRTISSCFLNIRDYKPANVEKAEDIMVDNFAAYLEAKSEIVQKTDVNLNSLTPHEQAAFLEYYRAVSRGDLEDEKDSLFDFIGIFGRDGLRTFLALRVEPSAAEKILGIAQNYSKPQAALIFEKFGDLLDRAEQIDAEINALILEPEKARAIDRPRASTEILRRAARFILYAFSEEGKTEKHETKVRALLARLDETDENLVTLAAIYKTAAKSGNRLKLAEIKGAEFSAQQASELTVNDRNAMLEIFIENRKSEMLPGSGVKVYSEKLLKQVSADFKMAMQDTKSKFYVLRIGGKIVSFGRVQQLGPNKLYAGSFNVKRGANDAGLGDSLAQVVLAKEGVSNTIVAEVRQENPALKYYIDKLGFRITGRNENYHDTGQTFIIIERPPEAAKLAA